MPIFSITLEQQKAIESLDWLNAHERYQRTGRTYALALHYLRQLVLLHPEKGIKVNDHYENRNADVLLGHIIQDLGRQIGCTIELNGASGNCFCHMLHAPTRAMIDAVTNFDLTTTLAPLQHPIAPLQHPITINQQQCSLWDFVKKD